MGYLRNAWYCAALGHELAPGKATLARTILDQPIVFYRDAAGRPVALADRCPHRFAPLSKGKVVDGVIECPYHGLRYGSTGACVHNPHGPIPNAARVPSFPLLERFGLLWIWMGEPARADADKLPDFGVIAGDAQHAVVSGYLHVRANYELVTDNLLDLSHAAYLHPFLSSPDSNARNRFEMKQSGNTVWSYNHTPGEPISGLFKPLWNSPSTVGDKRLNMRWDPPSNLLLDVGFTESGRPESEGPSVRTAHLLTPESAATTHYFWVAARDRVIEDASLSERIRNGFDAAFRNEDEPMIMACQDRMGNADLMSLKPVMLTTDAAAVRARRVLAAMINEESASPVSSATASRS